MRLPPRRVASAARKRPARRRARASFSSLLIPPLLAGVALGAAGAALGAAAMGLADGARIDAALLLPAPMESSLQTRPPQLR